MKKHFIAFYCLCYIAKSVSLLSQLTFFLVIIITPLASFADSNFYGCKRLFGSVPYTDLKRVKILKAGQAKTISLSPGKKVTLEISSNVQKFYYLGRESFNGMHYLLFAKEGSLSSFFHVDVSQIESFSTLRFQEDDFILHPTDQKKTGTCGAHAAAACVVAHSPSLKSNEFDPMMANSAKYQRSRLIQQGIERLYPQHVSDDRTFQEKVKQFLDENGIVSRTFAINSEFNENQLLELLKNNHAVYVSYRSRYETYYKRHEYLEGSRNFFPERQNLRFPNPFETSSSGKFLYFHTKDYDPFEAAKYHAVVFLKAFEIDGSTAVMVLDSATAEIHIWLWEDILSASRRLPPIVTVPGQQETDGVAGIPESTLQALKDYKSRSGIVDFVSTHPNQIVRVSDKEAWLQQPLVGQWVLLSAPLRHGETNRGGEAIVGRVSSIGKYVDGSPYVEYQPYSYESLGKSKNQESFGGTIQYLTKRDLNALREIHLIQNKGSEFFQVLQQAQPAQFVTFDWSEFPHSKPVKVRGPIISVAEDRVRIFDEKSKAVIEIGPGDFVSSFKILASKNREQEFQKFTEAMKKILMERHRNEGYYSDSVQDLSELERKLQTAQMVFYSNAQASKFDVSRIKQYSYAMVFLNEEYILYGKGDRVRRSSYGVITEVNADSIVFSFGHRELTLDPKNIAALFIFDRAR